MFKDQKQKLKQCQKDYYPSKKIRKCPFLYNIKMSEKTLKFGDVVNKKRIHAFKQPITLNLVDNL